MLERTKEMKNKYKTIMDVDLVLCFQEGEVMMPLRNMYGEPAMKIFKEMYLIHLFNINATKGVIPFVADFKKFLSEETGISVRKIEYVMKKFVEDGFVSKSENSYRVGNRMKNLFNKKKVALEELPWKDMPNYK